MCYPFSPVEVKNFNEFKLIIQVTFQIFKITLIPSAQKKCLRCADKSKYACIDCKKKIVSRHHLDVMKLCQKWVHSR